MIIEGVSIHKTAKIVGMNISNLRDIMSASEATIRNLAQANTSLTPKTLETPLPVSDTREHRIPGKDVQLPKNIHGPAHFSFSLCVTDLNLKKLAQEDFLLLLLLKPQLLC